MVTVYDIQNSSLTNRLFITLDILNIIFELIVCVTPPPPPPPSPPPPLNQDSLKEVTPVSFFWPPSSYWKPLTAFLQALHVLSLACAAVVPPLQIRMQRK